MFISETSLRVRYGETDRMGYVYYGNYAEYYEVGRVEALRSLGWSYREMEDSGILLPVYDFYIRYFRPAYYDDLLTIKTMIKERPTTRIRFDYEVYNSESVKINEGNTTLIFIDARTKRPCAASEALIMALDKWIGSPDK
jgi:acyl-CoA thioester hydrolase